MIIPPIVVAHVLACSLLIIYPVWDYFATRELRKGTDPQVKLRYYKKTVLLLWLATIAAFWSAGVKLFTLDIALPRFAMSHAQAAKSLGTGLAILVAIVSLLPQFQALRNPRVRDKLMTSRARAL